MPRLIVDGKSIKMNNAEIFSIDGTKEIDDISLKERNSYNKTVSFDQDLIDSLKERTRRANDLEQLSSKSNFYRTIS